MSSLLLLSAVSCCVEGTTCAWQSRPTWLALPSPAGLAAVAYGSDLQAILAAHRNFWTRFFRNFWKVQELVRLWREAREPRTQCWGEMSRTLRSLTDGADLLVTGLVFEEPAANVAEYCDIPLATLHYFPIRANRQLLPFLPAPLTRAVMTVNEWLSWRVTKDVEDAQRRELGLPKAAGPSSRRIAERGSPEIQAYDEVCFPGLAAEWAKWNSNTRTSSNRT